MDGINRCVNCSEKLLMEISKQNISITLNQSQFARSSRTSNHRTQYLSDNENTIFQPTQIQSAIGIKSTVKLLKQA